MYELERLAQGVPFEVLNQERDSVGIDACLAPVVAGSQSVGVVCLIDKRVFEKFYLGASRLSMRRMAARSMKASEVWTFNS
jgi:hypothetical protein